MARDRLTLQLKLHDSRRLLHPGHRDGFAHAAPFNRKALGRIIRVDGAGQRVQCGSRNTVALL
jgi:hypothetical protein